MCIKDNSKVIQNGNPKATGIIPNKNATPPTVNAYGICVRTWLIWLQELANELKIVVSEMGKKGWPKTARVINKALSLYQIYSSGRHADGKPRGLPTT